MNAKNMEVLVNVIGAVEAGHQTYGVRNYAAYAPPHHSSDDEVTITLGWAQFYGNNARELIRRIFNADQRLKTGSIASDIDYVRYCINIADDDRYYYAHNSDPFAFSCSTLAGHALYVCDYVKKDPRPADGHAIGGSVMDNALREAGFTKMAWSKAGGLKPGDALIVEPYHIAYHIKNGTMVAACGNGQPEDHSPTAITTYPYTAYGTPKWVWRPSKVHRINVGGIEKMLNKDWVAVQYDPTGTADQSILIDLITSTDGKRIQDEMFAEDMELYIADCEREYTRDVKAQMMYCEIRHLGGKNAVDRIFRRSSGFSLNSILASLKLDQKSPNKNLVGSEKYWSRHEKCVEFINKYAVDEGGSTVGVTAQDVLDVMRSWLGMSRDAQTHRPIIDIYNSHKPLARGYAVTYWDDYCDATVSAVFIKLNAVSMIGGTECGVQEHVSIFRNKGIWKPGCNVVPSAGWIIVYDWDGDGVADHIGFVESRNGNNLVCIEGNTNGGVVGRRNISVGNGSIMGYAAPNYDSVKPEPEGLKPGDHGTKVKNMQKRLIKCGYSCGDSGADGSFGDATTKAVVAFQKDHGLEPNAIFGPLTAEALEEEFIKVAWKRKGTATANQDYVPVRATASDKKDNILAQLMKGMRFEYSSRKYKNFIRVLVAGVGLGWIDKKYVKYD